MPAVDATTFAPVLAGLAVLLAVLILIQQRRQTIRLLRRMEKQERLLMDELTQLARTTVTREEYVAQWQALSRQMTAEARDTDRSQEARMDVLAAHADQTARTQENRLSRLTETVDQRMNALSAQQNARLTEMSAQISDMRATLERNVTAMRNDSNRRLDEMRQVVDEKLHQTLEKRLTESFRLVSEQLETVAKGLGEMRTLANGVGDLKNVLSNVKTRGIWGEVQLGALLSQYMTAGQYGENVEVVPGSGQRVEFAIRLPGRGEQPVWLPVDSKFPLDAYERLRKVSETGPAAAVQEAEKALRDAIRTEAKRISGKYIVPPLTTDFAVMFLPTEGLYAEALRAPGLAEELQTRWRVLPAGPTTLTALLNSLQVGFRTLAVEQRSMEVWKVVSTLRTDFGRFHELLSVTQNRLRQAAESLDKAAQRTRTIETHLREAQEQPTLPPAEDAPAFEQTTLFGGPPDDDSTTDELNQEG